MKFCASYNYDGKKWAIIIDADGWSDAEKRCHQLNLDLDGELVFTIPAWTMPNVIVNWFCRIRNAIHDKRVSRATRKLLNTKTSLTWKS